MSFKPWQWSLRARILWVALFFRTGRYSFSDIIQNIIDSSGIRNNELSAAMMLDDRFQVLKHAAQVLEPSSRIVMEFGVFQGETLKFIADQIGSESSVVGFDSFEGLPDDWGKLLPKGEFETPVPIFPEHSNIKLEIGLIEETLPKFLENTENISISLIHIDCDLYETTKFILERVLPFLSSKSIVVFDEYYGYPTFEEHEYKAWYEICHQYSLTVLPIAYSSHSVAFEVLRS